MGLVAEMTDASVETAIGGTLQQRIASCVEVLDKFLRQKEPIVSSIVVAEKSQTSGNFSTPTEAVAQILGIRDVKTVSPHSTLPEIGMDSIMGTEIKQVLEKDFEIVLTAQEIKTLSFSKYFLATICHGFALTSEFLLSDSKTLKCCRADAKRTTKTKKLNRWTMLLT